MSATECRKCGSLNKPERRYCGSCGTSVSAVCSACGFTNETEAAFCGGCGVHLRIAPSDVDRSRAFVRSNIPPELADRMLRDGQTIQGERKHVTVLFADIKESTALIEDLDAEQALNRIAPVLKIVMDAVHHYEGIVNRIEGDGLMALFGTPIAREDHAVCACLAAIRMRDAVVDFFDHTIDIRVGLNSGEVVVHALRNDLSIIYDAAGKTVHLAARMENIARPASICATSETLSLVQGFVEAKPLGVTKIKGIKTPQQVFELQREAPTKTRWQVRAERGLTKLIGREFELARLAKAFDSAKASRGQIVSVVGEPGVGKSRLVHQFVDFGETAGCARLEAAADQHARHSTYFTVSSLLRSWLDVAAGDPPPLVTRRLRDRVVGLDPSFEPFLPAISSLLDLGATEDTEWPDLDPSQRRYRIVEAVCGVLLKLAERSPLLIVVEDLHWIDVGSEAVLAVLAARLATKKMLVIVSYRTEYVLGWHELLNHSLIHVHPMGADEIDQMAVHLLGQHDSLGKLRRRLSSSVAGNPLFIEEFVRSLVETGVLQGKKGDYRLMRDIDSVQVPPTVETILAARIDNLGATEKSLLQTAAVIGKDVPLAMLQAMKNFPPDDLVATVATLEAADLIYQTRVRPQPEYSFKHELTREVTYHSLLRETRRQVHAAALTATETCFKERLEEQYDRLAHHAHMGQVWDRAVGYHLKSLVRAVRRWANNDAAAIFERGIEALAHLPATKQTLAAGIDFRLIVVSALVPLGRHRQLVDILEQADSLAQDIGDPFRLSAANCQLGIAHWMNGNHPAALEASEKALEIAQSIEEAPLQLAALHNRGMVFHETGEFRHALQSLSEALSMLTEEMDRKRVGWPAYPSVSIRTFMADALVEVGDYREAARVSSEAIATADAANHAYSQSMIYHVRARVHLVNGEFEPALTLATTAWDICQKLQIYKMYPKITSRLIEIHLARDDIGAAFDAFALTQEQEEEQHTNLYGWSDLMLARGRTYLAMGRFEEASTEAENCIRMLGRRGERPRLAHAFTLLGDISSQIGGRFAARAERHYKQAIETASATGMRPLEARCHRALGALYSTGGRDEDAAASLDRAVRVFARSA